VTATLKHWPFVPARMVRFERSPYRHTLAVLTLTLGFLAPWARDNPAYTGPEYLVLNPDTLWGMHGAVQLHVALCWLLVTSVVVLSIDEDRVVRGLTGLAVGVLCATRAVLHLATYHRDGVVAALGHLPNASPDSQFAPSVGLAILLVGGVALTLVDGLALYASERSAVE